MTSNTYAARDRILAAMGFASYGAYLRSDLWRVIRGVVLDGGRACVLCGQAAECVHHHYYRRENLVGESLLGMYPVCSGCHAGVEFRAGVKLTLNEVRARFNRMFVARKLKGRRR